MSNIYDDEWLARAKEDLARKGCPQCDSGNATLSREFLARPLASFSLSGNQVKSSVVEAIILQCPDCSLRGRLDVDD
jgi:hypothetical protein